jgi:hypothetical protein
VTAKPAASTDERLALARVLRGTGREFESAIRGTSMHGTLPEGVRIRIRCDGGAEAGPGAVVAFAGDGRLVAHRVAARGRGARARRWVVTLGDGCTICDVPVAVDAVLGTVIAREYHGVWQPVPGAVVRRGWRRVATVALLGCVRLALEADVRLAAALVASALFAQRLAGAARGTGRRLDDSVSHVAAGQP